MSDDEAERYIAEKLIAMRASRDAAQKDIVDLMAVLGSSAVNVTRQDRLLRRIASLSQQRAAQQSLLDEALRRISQSAARPPFAPDGCTVLHSASDGYQVAPEAAVYLKTGAIWGAGSGFAVACLLFLITVASEARNPMPQTSGLKIPEPNA